MKSADNDACNEWNLVRGFFVYAMWLYALILSFVLFVADIRTVVTGVVPIYNLDSAMDKALYLVIPTVFQVSASLAATHNLRKFWLVLRRSEVAGLVLMIFSVLILFAEYYFAVFRGTYQLVHQGKLLYYGIIGFLLFSAGDDASTERITKTKRKKDD